VAGDEPTVAVITMTRDEGRLLRRWVDHHGDQVGRDHVVVLDDHSADGSTDDLGCTVHRLPRLDGGRRFEKVRMALLNGVAEGLLAAYDYVAFLDVDEFLVPDPAVHASLGELLQARGRPDVLGVTALDLVHAPGDTPLDLDRGILAQRRFAKFAPVMCKPSVKRTPAAWTRGSHGITVPYAVDPALFMVHLKFADRDRLVDIARRRHEVHLVDGRAPKSGWARPAAEVLEMLDAGLEGFDPATVPEFEPDPEVLAAVVEVKDDGVHRTRAGGVRSEPVVRVPARLLEAF
jgi:hypothetical protein